MLDLLALSLEPGPAFDYVRIGVLALSFVCLAEFGRAGIRTIYGCGPGRWILVRWWPWPVLGVWPVLPDSCCYPLCSGTGRRVMGCSNAISGRKNFPIGVPFVTNRGSGHGGLCLVAGLVVPPTPIFFLPPGLITTHFLRSRVFPSN